MANKKKSSKAVSIDDIYETLKGRNFTEDLWLDLLSDIKEKPTYKRMKEMVVSAVNNKLIDFEQEPIDNAERTRRRAALTEISIMAYTVDRVISEVLYKRLQNEFKTLIVDVLEELQTKKPVEKSYTPVKINSMLENIESIFSDLSEKEEKKVTKSPESPKKVTIPKPAARKRGRPPGRANLNTSAESPKEKDVDSDGYLSIESISSVHTTDLSSFDDTVSVCTDDGINGRKKKVVTLKKANSMIVEGKLSQIYQIGKKSEKIKEALKDPSRKVLPQRKRKPNKKYNAETMYCQVKDYFSDRSDSSTSNPADDIATIQSQINKAKRMKTCSDDEKAVSSASSVSTRSSRNQSSSDSEASSKAASPTAQKSSTKRYNASDLYKPRFNFGSTCSTRGTEAFSVFSS